MSLNLTRVVRQVTSDVAAAVDSRVVFVGGHRFSVQLAALANLVEVLVSDDRTTWTRATIRSDGTTGINNNGSGRIAVFEEPTFAMFRVNTDAGGPRIFTVIFGIQRQDA